MCRRKPFTKKDFYMVHFRQQWLFINVIPSKIFGIYEIRSTSILIQISKH